MEQNKIYDDGTAELVLLRAMLPFVGAVWLLCCVAYFAGLVPAHEELGGAMQAILRVSTYAGGVGLTLAAAALRLARPPRIKLSVGWVLLTLGGSVLTLLAATTLFRLSGSV
ncbi:hypothetical protein AB4Y45_32525 [Paraburkholderia sp. EG287A]|uniref:hypothetical protein n=1 Tax=Paraburkholderia sp. EG287A TaxID=3237012 RepID=UPI0034D27038